MTAKDRSRLGFKIKYALVHPGHIVPYTRRRARDAFLWLGTRDHVSYYRAVMASDAARSHEGAVGSKTHGSWLKIGQMQFDYLVSHGLKPDMRMLEIGCGNLRAGCSSTISTPAITTASISPRRYFSPRRTPWLSTACRPSSRT